MRIDLRVHGKVDRDNFGVVFDRSFDHFYNAWSNNGQTLFDILRHFNLSLEDGVHKFKPGAADYTTTHSKIIVTAFAHAASVLRFKALSS